MKQFHATNGTTEQHANLLRDNPVAVRIFAIRHAKPEGYEADQIVNTTSGSSDVLFRQLSPFFTGPCALYDGYVSQTMENAWQFCKVYPEFVLDGEPTAEYWKWAQSGWSDPKAHRFPMGRGVKPLYSLWKGRKLDYIEARKEIYAPLYAEVVQKTDGFKALQQKYEHLKAQGRPLVLLDHDGWDYLAQGATLHDAINSPSPIMGHAFVLAGLLEGNHFWTS